MKIFIKTIFFTFIIIGISHAYAYQRKKVMPNYFIPNQDVNYQESQNIKYKKTSIKKQTSGGIVPAKSKTKIANAEPEFMQIYQEYKEDVTHISKTKEYPDTSQIKDDYQGMHTNDSFLVK